MDPVKFGVSTIPLNHAPYGTIKPENLVGANKGKVAVVTGAARGRSFLGTTGQRGVILLMEDDQDQALTAWRHWPGYIGAPGQFRGSSGDS